MSYAVKECFLTLQGEGVQSGSRAVFLRFAGCNLWSGREQDRATAQCNFCDTDFVGTDGEAGGKFADAESLADHVRRIWGSGDGQSPGGGRVLILRTGCAKIARLTYARLPGHTPWPNDRPKNLRRGTKPGPCPPKGTESHHVKTDELR